VINIETYTIYLTSKCNCNCKYCYLLSGKLKLNEDNYTQDSINCLLNKIIEKDRNFNIEFLGGEPTLEYKKIIDTVEYLENIPEVNVNSYIITTNGTFLPIELIDFIKKNPKIIYQISIDGTKYFNQLRTLKTGENTFDLVTENIKKLKINKVEKDQIRIHITLHPYNISGLYESIVKFIDIGIFYYVLGFVETTIKIDKNFINRTVIELDNISKYLINNNIESYIHINFFETPKGIPGKSYIYDESNTVIIGEFQSNDKKLETSKMTKQNDDFTFLLNYIREFIYNMHLKNLNEMI